MFWVDKMKDGPDNFGYLFDLDTISYGMDDDGDIMTSCVLKYHGNAKSLNKKKKKEEARKGKPPRPEPKPKVQAAPAPPLDMNWLDSHV